MQEYVEQQTVAVSVKAARLTSRALAAALKKMLAEMEKQRRVARTPHGRQSVKKLMNHYGAKNAIKLVGAPKDFDRIAREYHVDYAFHKTGPGQYLLFSRQTRRTPSRRPSPGIRKGHGARTGEAFYSRAATAAREGAGGKAPAEGTGQGTREGGTLNRKIKKYLLPSFPYLMAFWFFSKLGTAYRMAQGGNAGEKLFGMMEAIGPVFQNYAPGLGLFDLVVGVAGAVGLYFMVQSKIKKARKFRRDMEYGSARWGGPKDIAPFVDPRFENNVILTGSEFLTMNTRPKILANARNLNACVIGSSGSGKTRFWLMPQLLQAHSSYVVVDLKGGTLAQCVYFLQRKKGYKVRVFNSIDFSKSMHYNPLAYIKTESDVLKFVNALIANTKGEGKEGDPFWTKAETLRYCALVAYIVFEGLEEERNMNTLVEMINSMEVREDDESFKNAVDYMFDGLARRSPQHFAVRQYAKYKLASGDICSK